MSSKEIHIPFLGGRACGQFYVHNIKEHPPPPRKHFIGTDYTLYSAIKNDVIVYCYIDSNYPREFSDQAMYRLFDKVKRK